MWRPLLLYPFVALAQARLKALCARHGWEFEWMTEAWLILLWGFGSQKVWNKVTYPNLLKRLWAFLCGLRVFHHPGRRASPAHWGCATCTRGDWDLYFLLPTNWKNSSVQYFIKHYEVTIPKADRDGRFVFAQVAGDRGKVAQKCTKDEVRWTEHDNWTWSQHIWIGFNIEFCVTDG